MICAISGEPAEHPVVNVKNGKVYEKRLVEAHIQERGTDPVTNEDCSTDDLVEIDVKGANEVVRPRPGSLTSIPSLLGALQTEWDAMVLETFQLKQQLNKSQQELSNALYQHDAAVRVVARLTKERDEVRDGLAELAASIGQAAPAPTTEPTDTAMEESTEATAAGASSSSPPQEIVERIKHTSARLQPQRKGRKISDKVPSAEVVSGYIEQIKTKQLFSSVLGTSLDVKDQLVLAGGGKSQAGIFSLAEQKLVCSVKCSAIVTAACFSGDNLALGTKNGGVEIFNQAGDKLSNEDEVAHDSKVVAIAAHPCGLIVSASASSVVAIHDESNGRVLHSIALSEDTDALCTAAAVHPDGVLLAVGIADQIHIVDLTTGDTAHKFDHGAAVGSIAFSENGYTMAVSGGANADKVYIYHLGKQALTQTIDGVSGGSSVRFDTSGQYLAVSDNGSGKVYAYSYNKPSKLWQEVFVQPVAQVAAVAWTSDAAQLVTITQKGSIHVFSQ